MTALILTLFACVAVLALAAMGATLHQHAGNVIALFRAASSHADRVERAERRYRATARRAAPPPARRALARVRQRAGAAPADNRPPAAPNPAAARRAQDGNGCLRMAFLPNTLVPA